jgi:hypothetical protein
MPARFQRVTLRSRLQASRQAREGRKERDLLAAGRQLLGGSDYYGGGERPLLCVLCVSAFEYAFRQLRGHS